MGFKMSSNTNMDLRRVEVVEFCIYESQYLFTSDISYYGYAFFTQQKQFKLDYF
jgi:hypothetical protein